MAVSVARNTRPRPTTSLSFGELVTCPFPTVTAAFYHQASSSASSSTHSHIAVRDLSGTAPRELTYPQLASHAQALALRLRGLGVQPRQRIPLVVKRGLEMVVGIWAILSCGAQYVPLDGGVVPDSTIKHVVEQSGGDVVLCLSTTEHRIRSQFPHLTPVLIDQYMAADPAEPSSDGWIDLASPDAGCYVIYTSGTTGKPKGVDVTHRNVANLVCLSPGGLGIRPGMCVGQLLNISFDMAAWEIFACLCNGGTLVVRGSQWEPTIRELDVLICTPTILSKYHPAQYPKIKVVATAGEPTSQALADLWATHATYWNCCGPTETTIVNTMSRHVAGDPVSIGRPTPNNSVYIVDDAGEPVPVGVPGVMWAGGHGVSRGYVGLESKTSESYIPDPFVDDGSHMYCTGDLGQWRLDGSIDILGRCDDQVKVKGFRVELDGVSSSLASAPGVSRATALMVDGDLHGFVTPSGQSIEAILEYVRTLQPYYAVPAKIHQLDEFPTTANGKIDKKMLRVAAEPVSVITEEDLSEKHPASAAKMSSDCGTLIETRSSSSTFTVVSDTPDLDQDMPSKRLPQPLRGLRHRILIVYRLLFSLVGLTNMAALIAFVVLSPGPEWLAILTAANLVTAVLVRQDAVINLLYTLFCSMPKGAPLWMRTRCAKIYHLGGVHSGAGVCATSWLLASTIRSTVTYAKEKGSAVDSLATIVVSWLLSALCCTIVGFAWPSFRKNHHNLFERLHRFLGWTALCLFWVRTVLSVYDATSVGQDLGLALARSPGFWMLGVATCSIASSWFFLRRVPVNAVPLSDHAIQLHFGYTVPVNGSFTRISTRPLLEWHSFATIPTPKPSGTATKPGYSLVVSKAGDWTEACIRNPPTHLWVRGLPACGVMRIATLFNRVVVIATGSGIGPLLGHIGQPSCPTQLIWSTPNPEQTFGKSVIDKIRRSIPGAIIHDTRVKGRPDLVKMGFNLAKDFGAEAVIIIANEKITKKVVYGLESRGLPAYGAIWDS
ncbi:AMP-binding enzyme [Hirsutella rhossiliensis]|uniref:AMP-binding enzyme domain-containing protein n=1 Tax=Hirsutella rhossiliensis TaxID=111463 RepID=A0A9P8MRR3_9HYPO|nr:AMP-binding enzyme domain-containing protein [Hirsutella rhossiliensis]KAH0961033.1 AMP-binding enzyme domain-containing protein [Hirsutella rhossiliensis]